MSLETTLIKRLTKINRMDIVHLIETNIIKSAQEETSSHTYAEIEQTIAMDQSEGTQIKDNTKQFDNSEGFIPTRGKTPIWLPCVFSGFSALHEDIDSPRSDRRRKASPTSSGSGQDVPVVSAEELSPSLSSLPESLRRSESDSTAKSLLRTNQKEKLQKEVETTW